jgi:hypothetical protein
VAVDEGNEMASDDEPIVLAIGLKSLHRAQEFSLSRLHRSTDEIRPVDLFRPLRASDADTRAHKGFRGGSVAATGKFETEVSATRGAR